MPHNLPFSTITHYVRELDCLTVRGRSSEIRIFEIMDFRDDGTAAEKARFLEYYEEALQRYRRKDAAGSLEMFKKCLSIKPGDRPVELLIKRLTGP